MRTAVLVVASAALAASQCTKTFPNASFDLTQLRKASGAYAVRDNRGNQNVTVDPNNPAYDSYLYYFNVCDDVKLDTIIFQDVEDKCSSTTGAGMTVSTGKSAAFQYSPMDVADKYKCYRLSGDVASHPGNETWSLIEPENPSRGVQVKYEGGDLCCQENVDSCSNPVHRSLELQFYCKDDTSNSFDDETVLEYGSCSYRIWLDTSYGCPTECSITDGNLCNGHGVCDFDTTIKKPRCFCNNGWKGTGCATEDVPEQTSVAAVVIVVIVSFLLVGLMGFLYYLWQRIRGLRLDPNAYKSLTGGPEADAGGIYDD